jgi:hypothetical protein
MGRKHDGRDRLVFGEFIMDDTILVPKDISRDKTIKELKKQRNELEKKLEASEKDAIKWRRFWSVFDQLGVYPAKYDGKDRTAYGEGWNDCSSQLLSCYGIIEKFYESIDPSLPDKIQKLNDDEILEFHLRKEGYLSDVIMLVRCNDLFWWACADAEEVTIEEIPSLYDTCYDEDENKKRWASDIWCCLHRGMRPQHPIEKTMKEKGVWTDELEKLPVREYTG